MAFLVLFSIACCALASDRRTHPLLVVTSPSTPTSFSSQLYAHNLLWLPPYLSLSVASIADLLDSSIQDAEGVIDATFEQLSQESVAGVCQLLQVPHLVLGYAARASIYKWTFYVNRLQRDVAEALDAVVEFFGWGKVNLVSDANNQMSEADATLRDNSDRTYESLVILGSDSASIDLAISRELRMRGNRVSVFLTESSLSELIQTTQNEKNIGGVGYANIFPLYSSLFESISTGNLIVAEEELKDADTPEQYSRAVLAYTASLIPPDIATAEELRLSLEDRFPSHVRSSPFSLLNTRDGKRVEIGSLSLRRLVLKDSVSFLGNTTEVPRNAKSPLSISGNLGNADSIGYIALAEPYYKGAILAVETVNDSPKLIPNFQLELFNFSAGAATWNYDFAYRNVYPNREKLGLAVLSGYTSIVTVELVNFLSNLGYKGPVIGSLTGADIFSSRALFPRFIRTMLSMNAGILLYTRLFMMYGWKECGLIVLNDTIGLNFRSLFVAEANKGGITIVNDADSQVIPAVIPSMDVLTSYSDLFQRLIDTRVRVLVTLVHTGFEYVLDFLYEKGLRAGDLLIVCSSGFNIGFFQTNKTEVNKRRSEIARGALVLLPAVFSGPIGKKVAQNYQTRFNMQPHAFACYYYDSILMVTYALDIIIRLGKDYKDPDLLLKTMRGSRFVGCTGLVVFEQNNNDRALVALSLVNLRFDPASGLITNFTIVGTYDRAKVTLMQFEEEVIWGDGTMNVPTAKRLSTIGCPFEDRFDQEFVEGKRLLYGVCTAIAILTLLSVGVAWRKWRKHPLQLLKEKKEIQTEDVAMMVWIWIDLLQWIAMGPNLRFVGELGSSILSLVVMDFSYNIDYKDGGFGVVWVTVTALIAMWILMCGIVLFRVGEKLEFLACDVVARVSEFVVPLIGSILFLPFASVIVDTYVCVRGVAPSPDRLSFSDSYLRRDCYLSCWQGAHETYAIISALVLVLFLPSAIALKPVWQELSLQLNIKTSQSLLMLKTLVQVWLILLSKTVKVEHPLVHSALFLGTLLLLLVYSVVFPCYSYKRVWLWHVLGLFAICWSTILAIAYDQNSQSVNEIFAGLLFAGWSILLLFGAIFQAWKIPSLLYRKPGVNTQVLFKFAFRPATHSLLNSLQNTLQKAGKRSKVVIPSSDVASRYAISMDESLGEGQAVSRGREVAALI